MAWHFRNDDMAWEKHRRDTHADKGRERLMISMSCWIARLCYRRIMPQVQFIYCIEGSKMTRSFCINKWLVWTRKVAGVRRIKRKNKSKRSSWKQKGKITTNDSKRTRETTLTNAKKTITKELKTVCLPSSPSCAGKKDSLLLYLQRTRFPLYMCYTLANTLAFGMTDSYILFYYLFQAIFETLNKFLYVSIRYCYVDLDIYLNIARFTYWVSDKLRCIEEETWT